MPSAKVKNLLHLHFLVFIAGFTAILGELVSIGSVKLVWFRMSIAGIIMLIYIFISGRSIRISKKALGRYSLAGLLIAAHWITFFESINQANVSIALSMFSTGAFFASFIEPLVQKRKIRIYEIVFGLIVIIGVFLITKSELAYLNGIILGVVSAIFSTSFSVLNAKFVEKDSPSTIAFYEFLSGVLAMSLYLLLVKDAMNLSYFKLSKMDWIYTFILASVCTAYAFIAVIYVMKKISAYTVVLSYNLEPVYGIVLAILLFPKTEIMGFQFYIGATLILSVILINGLVTKKRKVSKLRSVSGNQ